MKSAKSSSGVVKVVLMNRKRSVMKDKTYFKNRKRSVMKDKTYPDHKVVIVGHDDVDVLI
jgi:hypothetical protein